MCILTILGLIVVYIIYNLVTVNIEITCVIEKKEKKEEIEDKTMLDELLAKKET
jgi:mannose/fructose/N-acetylgalactosamine-specific phosphotransferase system component IID